MVSLIFKHTVDTFHETISWKIKTSFCGNFEKMSTQLPVEMVSTDSHAISNVRWEIDMMLLVGFYSSWHAESMINDGSNLWHWHQCWSININVDQWKSIPINTSQYILWSSIDWHWSILRSIDWYWSSLIGIELYLDTIGINVRNNRLIKGLGGTANRRHVADPGGRRDISTIVK